MGTGTIYPVRVFHYNDPNLLLPGEDLRFIRMGPQSPFMALAISAGQYLLAVGAVLNTLTLVIELGTNAVVAYNYTSYYYPLTWWLIAVLTRIIAAVPSNILQRSWLKREGISPGNVTGPERASERAPSDQRRKITWRKRSTAWVQRLLRVWGSGIKHIKHAIRSEVTICANQPLPDKLPQLAWVVFLNCCCGALGFFHIVYGTLILSSLLFIMNKDAILCVSRFVMSAACCRLSFHNGVCRHEEQTGKAVVGWTFDSGTGIEVRRPGQ